MDCATNSPNAAYIVRIALLRARAMGRCVVSDGRGRGGLKMRIMKIEAKGCVRKKMSLLAREIAPTKPELRALNDPKPGNVTNEAKMVLGSPGA
jgi:hypothetical protein